jgi:excisionase family DNA binding protein
MDEDRRAITITEFAARYSIGRSKIYEEAAAGRIKLRKVGKKTLITVEDAEKWLANLPAVEPKHAA